MGMYDDVGRNFVGDIINGATMLAMQWKYFITIDMNQSDPLSLLLKEIGNLCTEAIFVKYSQ